MEQKNEIGIFQCSNGYIPKNTVYIVKGKDKTKSYTRQLYGLGI
jgi:hypothetical protein